MGYYTMNDIIFTNGFRFCTMSFDKFHHTDNSVGVQCHYLAYMISGKYKIVTDSDTVEISKGDIFYIPNKCKYRSYWYGNPNIKFISLGFLYLPNFDNKSYSVQLIPHNEKAVELFYALSDCTRLSAVHIGLFYTLAGILIPLMSAKTVCRTKEIVEQTKNNLSEHPFAKTSDLAKNCAVSEAALYFAFQKSSDITPNQMRNQILLEKAKDILITTDMSVENISDYLQFSSPSYFRKKFKRYFNMTPKEMRKRYRI